MKDYDLWVSSWGHRKCDGLPHFNFDYVKQVCKLDQDDIFINPQMQIDASPEDELTIFYYELRKSK